MTIREPVADPCQVAGISHYSRDPRATSIPPDQALRFKATSGTAEEVVALAPDVVVAGGRVAPSTILALRRFARDDRRDKGAGQNGFIRSITRTPAT